MEVAVTTDVGAGQRFNDDAWCHEQLQRHVTLLAVADGFGRPQGVPSASIVLDAVRDVIRRELRRATFPPRSLTANDLRELLVSAFADGNERLLELGGGTQDYVAAGSTCTLALIVSNQAFVAHLGDSRAYLLRRGELVQLTSDESFAPELVRSGTGQPSATRNRQMPALLNRALGLQPAIDPPPKIAHYTLHAHDAILLCTDGASRTLSFNDLQAAVTARDSARAAAERILGMTRSAGGTDNATVIVARNATVHGAPPDSSKSSSATPWRWAAALAASLALFLVTGAIARAYWFGDSHLFLAQDGAGDVALFAGAPGSLLGVPLHVERTSFAFAVSALDPTDQRAVEDGMPISTPQAADAVIARWQAQSRH
jgi:serine/threonine protein phosphatase PrpC